MNQQGANNLFIYFHNSITSFIPKTPSNSSKSSFRSPSTSINPIKFYENL